MLRPMRKPNNDDMHWEQLVRTMIDILGIERFCEIVDYVTEQMADERSKLRRFAVETRRAN